MRKIIRFALILVVLVVAAGLLLPILFKDEIFALVREESNKYIKGEVVLDDMSLSLFRDFPNLTLGVSGFAIIGEGDFEDIKLVSAEELALEINLFSAFSGSDIEVEGIRIDGAEIYVLTLPDGSVNYDIVRETEETTEEEAETEGAAMTLTLKEFAFLDSKIIYDDRQGDIYASLSGIKHRLSGDFSQEVVDMKTVTDIESMNVTMDGVSYFRNTRMVADVGLTYVMESGHLTMADNELAFNDLHLKATGGLTMGDDMDIDLQFSAPSTEFAEVLSLIPEVFYNDFESIQTGGVFALNAFVKGIYNDNTMPGFGLDLKVSDAHFKYPDLPASAEKINLELHVNKPQGDVDLTEVNIPTASALLAGQPIEARLHVTRPVSNPNVDAYLKTDMDLKQVSQLVPTDDLTYEGRVVADLEMKGKMSDFENQNLQAVTLGGRMDLSKFKAQTSAFGLPVVLDTASMKWSPSTVRIPTVSGSMGKSTFAGSGNLDNLAAYVLSDTTLRGRFIVKSTLFDLDELANAVPEAEGEEDVADSEMTVVRIPTNLDMDLRAEVDKVIYDGMELTNVRGTVTLVDGVAAMSGVKMNGLGGEMGLDGSYDSRPAQPEVNMDIRLQDLALKSAFESLDMLRSYAPIAQSATGNLSTTFSLNALMTEDMTPDLSTISASGLLRTAAVAVQPEIMSKVGTLLNNNQYSRLDVGNTRLSYRIENGRIEVEPFDVKIGNQTATIAGSNGLDQSLDYTLNTELPIDQIKVPQAVRDLGLTGKIDVALKFGGTVTNPTVSANFGDITSGLQSQVQNVIQNQIDNARDEVVNRVNEAAEQIMAEARAQADRVVSEARVQAERVRTEGRNAAQRLKDEAKRNGDKLIADAGSNPIKKAAAQVAARELMSEAETRGNQLIAEADRRAKQIEDTAQEQADKIIADAEARAKLENE